MASAKIKKVSASKPVQVKYKKVSRISTGGVSRPKGIPKIQAPKVPAFKATIKSMGLIKEPKVKTTAPKVSIPKPRIGQRAQKSLL